MSTNPEHQQQSFNCLSNWKFERLLGPLDEIVTVIMLRRNMAWWRQLIRQTRCQDVGCFILWKRKCVSPTRGVCNSPQMTRTLYSSLNCRSHSYRLGTFCRFWMNPPETFFGMRMIKRVLPADSFSSLNASTAFNSLWIVSVFIP